MQIGFIGLGKMGSRMVLKLLEEGHEVVVWNRSKESIEELKGQIANSPIAQNLHPVELIEELVQSLQPPRVIWVMVTAGEATQGVLDSLEIVCVSGDIIVDGGNSHYTDTERRFTEFSQKQIRFLGIGVSGGILAAENGYPLMVGGDKSAYQHIVPILDSLVHPRGGHEYFGEGGRGHFVKMIHNGIEYGIMQSLGEGFGVLQNSPYQLDLLKVAKLYQKGTLVSGFMLDRVVDVLSQDSTLSDVVGAIEESGEARWMIEESEKVGLPVATIREAFRFRLKSKMDVVIQETFAAKLVAALRQAFGGHVLHRTVEGDEVKKK